MVGIQSLRGTPRWRGLTRVLWLTAALCGLVAVYRRLMLEAKVGPTAPWAADERLMQTLQQRQPSKGAPQNDNAVRVLIRHKKRLHPFIIELILTKDLRSYELSDHEEQALRSLLLETAPNTASGLAPLLRHSAQLVRFANRSALWDIARPKELLSGPHLTQFMQWYRKQISEDLYNEARRVLTKAGRVLHRDNPYKEVPAGRRQEWSRPTDEEELQGQWQQAMSYPVAKVRRMLLALICLSRGAGLRTTEIQLVHGTDVVRRARGRTVVLVAHDGHTREVVVLRRFGVVLQRLAALSGERLLLEGATGRRGVMEPARAMAKLWDDADAAFPSPDPLANAYFLEIAQRRVRVSRVFKVLPGKTIRGLEDLRPYMEETPGGPEDDVEGLEDNGISYFTPDSVVLR